jgi:hypothetical protein
MATVKARVVWDGADAYPHDVLSIIADPEPAGWMTEPLGDFSLAIYRELERDGEETERIVGVEVIGFLAFEDWDALPKLDVLWELPGQEPLPLEDLLKRLQRELRERAPAAARGA